MVAMRLLKAALRDIWAQVLAQPEDGAVTLRQFLLNQEIASRASIAGGQIVTITANGHTAEFSQPGGAGLNQIDIVQMWDYLVDEFDNAATELEVTSGEVADGTKDAQIEARMEARLRPIKGFTTNFMFLSK